MATVRVTRGDIEEGQVALAVQCWDEQASESHIAFQVQSLDSEDLPAIDEQACVFTEWEDPDLPVLGDEG